MKSVKIHGGVALGISAQESVISKLCECLEDFAVRIHTRDLYADATVSRVMRNIKDTKKFCK